MLPLCIPDTLELVKQCDIDIEGEKGIRENVVGKSHNGSRFEVVEFNREVRCHGLGGYILLDGEIVSIGGKSPSRWRI